MLKFQKWKKPSLSSVERLRNLCDALRDESPAEKAISELTDQQIERIKKEFVQLARYGEPPVAVVEDVCPTSNSPTSPPALQIVKQGTKEKSHDKKSVNASPRLSGQVRSRRRAKIAAKIL